MSRAPWPPWRASEASEAHDVPAYWRWWPYALVQPVLTIALFFPDANPFLDAAALSAFVLFLRTRPGPRAWGAWLALAVCIGLAGRATGTQAVLRAPGFAGILILGFLSSYPGATGTTRDRSQEAVGLCLAIPVIVYALGILRGLHPETYDPVLAGIDAWGPPVAWRLARAANLNSGFRYLSNAAYIGLPLALMIVGELERPHTSRRRSVYATVALAAIIGVLSFQVVPATGPKYAFAGYPGDQPIAGASGVAPPFQTLAPRNAMPSLHVTWAMLVAWHAARVGWLAGGLGGLFLVATILAAMATGEHYLVDLVMALPFTLAIAAAVAGNRRVAALSFLLVAAGLLAIASSGWALR